MTFHSVPKVNPPGPLTQSKISMRDAETIVAIVRRLSGVSIDPGNFSFLELRVNRRLRESGIPSMARYIALLEGLEGPVEAHHLVESLVTHTTNFFRESGHFDFLARTGFADLLAKGYGKTMPLTIWSAACSNGAELWSAGFTIDQFARKQLGGMDWRLIGTDISRKILHKAANAVYTEEELLGLPADMRPRYLLRSRMTSAKAPGGMLYRIVPEIRTEARFHWANLVDFPVRLDIQAHVIFLRNVLIYFEAKEKNAAIKAVTARLRIGGYLLTGHSEAITPLPDVLRQIGPSIYQKVRDED